jgi:hypothetical protein
LARRPPSVFSTAAPARRHLGSALTSALWQAAQTSTSLCSVSGTGIFGNVGIGTTTPGPNVEIFDSNAGARSTCVANTLLGLERNGQAFINIIGGAMSLLGLDSVIPERRPKVASDTTTIPTGFLPLFPTNVSRNDLFKAWLTKNGVR